MNIFSSQEENRKPIYKKCASQSCANNKICQYTRMNVTHDPAVDRPLPLTFGDSNQLAKKANDEYSITDFKDRNFRYK